MKFPSLSSRAVIRALRKAGFVEAPDRGKGSHRAFVKKEPRGTLLAILEQAGLTREEFLSLL